MSELKIHAGELDDGRSYCRSMGNCVVIDKDSFVVLIGSSITKGVLCGNCINTIIRAVLKTVNDEFSITQR